ncbi:MAG: hypothetical protein CVU57_06275 [Deltaproteobacteria bacterium HGW-Deltaproteobacteria-15]|jgi:hypothetical protein|nr:MAG: hypothetical protein CVU57_06275 [Deltaproteobacteria bacterium HGW-Deltaproteobacteria-15]
MAEKWIVVYEYDLENGMCFMAKEDAGKGKVAMFDSREQAEEWVSSSGNIDEGMWDINYIKITL